MMDAMDAMATTTPALPLDGLKQRIRDAAGRDPMESIVVTVLGGALLFFYAEKGHNPKVRSYFDALVYVSTCVSVGYADIFPQTKTGKAIASALMTFGPAIAAAALEPPAREGPEPAAPVDPKLLEIQGIIVTKLEAILGELHGLRGPLDPKT